MLGSAFTLLPLLCAQHATALTISLPQDGPCANELIRAKAPGSDHHDWTQFGVCLHHNANPAAREVFHHILDIAPDFAYAHVNLGAWYSIAGNYGLAIQHLETYFFMVGGIYGDGTPADIESIRDGPPCRSGSHSTKNNCVNALSNMGAAYFSQQMNSTAPMIYLTRAIEIGDEHMLSNAYANLGGHLARIGDEDSAADALIKGECCPLLRRLLQFIRIPTKIIVLVIASVGFWISLKQGDVDHAAGLLVRRALLTPTVASSIDQTEQVRIAFSKRVRDVTALAQIGGSGWNNDDSDLFRLSSGMSTLNEIRQIPRLAGVLSSWTNGVQTPHFHLHYKGYYDLPIQLDVSEMFTAICPRTLFEVAPHLLTQNENEPATSRKRVGFISALIGDDEPHGLLVLDVIRSLSQLEYFEFFVISSGSKPVSPEFYRVTNGRVYMPGFGDTETRQLLKSLHLDCLIYLEAMNNALLYFLGYQRFAHVQILVMGAPVTSGIPTFDYFVSGDLLEHPFRTQLNDDHYSEQVVLFDGMAISFPETQYHPLQDSTLAAGDAVSLSNHTPIDQIKLLHRENAHVYLCFQSVFKIQATFDHVIADILLADYRAHVVLQASRYSNQTATFESRLQGVLKQRFCSTESIECPSMTKAYSRVHFIARVKSDEVLELMQQSSVILHPFPFGGSKTAFDAINAGVPIVTFPQRYLRGRMAAVFLRFMDLHEVDPDVATCCMASTVSDYVSKALRLASDESYRQKVSGAFRARRNRMFDDEFVAIEWAKLLTRALGIKTTEVELISQMGHERESYQQDEYFATKVEEEQTRWRNSVMLSDLLSPH